MVVAPEFAFAFWITNPRLFVTTAVQTHLDLPLYFSHAKDMNQPPVADNTNKMPKKLTKHS
jgi:hypothetical protein